MNNDEGKHRIKIMKTWRIISPAINTINSKDKCTMSTHIRAVISSHFLVTLLTGAIDGLDTLYQLKHLVFENLIYLQKLIFWLYRVTKGTFCMYISNKDTCCLDFKSISVLLCITLNHICYGGQGYLVGYVYPILFPFKKV